MPIDPSIYRAQEPVPSPMQAVSDIYKLKAQQQQQQIEGLKLGEMQHALQLRTALSKAITETPMVDEEGTSIYDIPTVTKKLAAAGYGAESDDIVKHLGGINTAFRTEQAAKKALVVQGATSLLAGGADPDLTLHFMDLLEKNNSYPKETLDKFRDYIRKNPDKTGAILRQFVPLAKPERGAPGSASIDPYTQQVIPGSQVADRPTESEIALKAAAGDPQSLAAMKLLKPESGETSSAQDARFEKIQTDLRLKKPVTVEDRAWADAYRERKLIGPEASAAAAADRQASTIAQQTAQQGRTQDFQEKQVGRKELTDKVEAPYQTALASSSALRDTVKAAAGGNVTAAALQNLETTMAAIRSQGLNRINTVELGVTANAGSMWDRINSWAGKAASGQPVPPNIQKDIVAFADILDKAAYKKYSESHKAITKRYGLQDEPPLPPPSPDADTPAKVNPFRK